MNPPKHQQVLDAFHLRVLSSLVDLDLRTSQKHHLGTKEKRRWLCHLCEQSFSMVAQAHPQWAPWGLSNTQTVLGFSGRRKNLLVVSPRWS